MRVEIISRDVEPLKKIYLETAEVKQVSLVQTVYDCRGKTAHKNEII